jgi:teichuronic acid biosynthesis glycosyltransferase TuaC
MLRVLVLTCRFPDRLRPNLGNFVERQTLELAARPGVEVEVVAPIGRSPFRRVPDGLPVHDIWKSLSVHRLRFPQFRYSAPLRPHALAWRLLPLAETLHGRRPFDVVSAEFSWPDGPAAIAAARRLGVPVVIKARGMEFENRLRAAATRGQLVRACRAAQGLLAVSGSLRQSMVAAGLPAERIAVHHPAVDPVLFRPGDREAARAQLGLSGPLLLAVGNLIPAKGHRLAIEALAGLETGTLMIVGAGPERSALLALAKRLGVADRLRLPGSLPHALLPSLFAAADVTLHPSLVEGFGNVRLESLACGTPIVTTAVGDAAKIVDRPAAGRIVEPNGPAIAAAVTALLEAPPPPAETRAAALRFGWDRQVDELLAHLRAAAESPTEAGATRA